MTSIFKSPFWEAFGLFGGMIIGSGMFLLPYAVSVSGLWASIAAVILAFFAVLSIHLAYGEIVVNTEEKHRFPGYAKFYLGNFAGNFNKFFQIVSFNIALLIYGVLGGVFLATIFGGSEFYWSLFFFGISAGILFFESIERIGFLNFILVIPLIAVVLFLSFLAFIKGEVRNIPLSGSDPFFVFGIFLFALTGLSAIPDTREVLKSGEEARIFKRVIISGTAVPLILYIVFVFSMLMALGGFVPKDAISGLSDILGRNVVIFGALAGFLAVITSFLALAYDLRKIYELDIKAPKALARTASVFLPALLFVFGLKDFAQLISIVGGVFIAIDGFFVIFILREMRKTGRAVRRFLPFGPLQQALLFLVFTASIIYELVYQIL